MDYQCTVYLSAFRKTGRIAVDEFPAFVQDFVCKAIQHLADHGLVTPLRNEANEVVSAELTPAGVLALQSLENQ